MQEWLILINEYITEHQWLKNLLFSFSSILLIYLIRFVLLHIVFRGITDKKSRFQWKKWSIYICFFLGILVIGGIWYENFSSLSNFLGLLTAGFAIAMREPILNLVGWLFIISSRPFSIGDRIEIGEHAGDVIDIRVFQLTLMEIGNWVDSDQSTGRILHIPNGIIFQKTLANYSKGFHYIWDEIAVVITFESNWQDAKKNLEAIIEKHAADREKNARKQIEDVSRKFMIYYSKLTPKVYTSVKNHGVALTIRYLCEPRQRRGNREIIWEKVLNNFAKNPQIELAYPTQRFYQPPPANSANKSTINNSKQEYLQ